MADKVWAQTMRAYRRLGVAYMCGALEWTQKSESNNWTRKAHMQLFIRFKSAKIALYVVRGHASILDFMRGSVVSAVGYCAKGERRKRDDNDHADDDLYEK
ncbi:hypothetical protein T492DRAFT_839971 [Pavlovales sp. CCMP2436]|nr:hypothetical protein T492DRAFT_839971 [Pavlovales sp. CCMP2436]